MWSACSWVTSTALIVSGATPRRASRATVSRTAKPQSMRTRVSPTSTTRPLPSLPLPSDAKRIGRSRRPCRLLELVAQQRQDALARLRAIRVARRILAAHGALRRGLDDLDPVLFRLVLVVGLPERQELRQKAFLAVLARHVGVGIGEAHEIDSGRAIAIDDGEAAAVERETHATPRAIERIVDDQRGNTVGLLQPRVSRRGGRRCGRRCRDRLRLRRPE